MGSFIRARVRSGASWGALKSRSLVIERVLGEGLPGLLAENIEGSACLGHERWRADGLEEVGGLQKGCEVLGAGYQA